LEACVLTKKLYYEDAYLSSFTAEVKGCEQVKDGYEIILDRTAFYPEGGGQPCDTGVLKGAVEVEVSDVQEKNDEIVHLVNKPLEIGSRVEGEINWERRFDLMQQHSGEHIVSGFINAKYGYNNVGFHMGSEMITVDLDGELDTEQLAEIESKVNAYIWLNKEVEELHPNSEELKKISYRSKKELTGDVRLIRFPDADLCACCGTHVKSCGEIGLVKLVSCQKFHEGVRIEMLSGKRAIDYLNAINSENGKISNLLSAKVRETSTAVERLLGENQSLKLKISEMEAGLLNDIAKQYVDKDFVFINKEGLTPDSVRKLTAQLIEQNAGVCAVFSGNDKDGYKYAVGQKNGDLKELVKQMNTELNGRGGGKPFFAQGSVSCGIAEIEKFFSDKI
jgi:alanyl-tRNA synthetase